MVRGIGADGQIHSWVYTNSTWINSSLGNGEPVGGVTVAGTGTPAAPGPGSGPTTIAPKPRKGHVHVRMTISWRWGGVHTRLRRLRLIKFPRRISIAIAEPGLLAERAEIEIRNNREPKAALL